MKINKVYSSFYNGISEQPPELMVETQCKDMINCIPSVIKGLQKRPPLIYKQTSTNTGMRLFHTYDRGDDVESYLMTYSTSVASGSRTTVIYVFDINGNFISTVNYSSTAEAAIAPDLKALTVGDTTWIYNKNLNTSSTQAAALDVNYNKVAYYWIKRASGDKYNPYNYAVYIDDITIACNPDKPSSDTHDPATGCEDSDVALNILVDRINGTNISGWNATGSYNTEEPPVWIPNPNYSNYSATYTCERKGNVLKVWKNTLADFTFSSWDSFGSQASEGWKGSIQKLQDLPSDFGWDNTYIGITGTDTSDFTDYYVKWNGTTWEEAYSPIETKTSLTNMPRKLVRNSDGSFSLVAVTWELPKVGNKDNNPDPSFVGLPINHLVFYKNRLGVVANDSIVLSETGGYENFFVKTVLSVQDTDPIDIAIATNQASKIYYAVPFNSSLYLFTKYAQYELASGDFLSPKTVNITTVSNYAMDITIEPKAINDSLFFISKTGTKQQLREYIKTEKLSVKGIDLNVTTPNLFSVPIKYLIVNSTAGYVICGTNTSLAYVYNFIDNNSERVQSAWSKWQFASLPNQVATSWEYFINNNILLVMNRTSTNYIYNALNLTDSTTTYSDTLLGGSVAPVSSLIKLPTYYPHLTEIGTPKDSTLLKKATIYGTGDFVSRVYRIDYDKYYVKSFTDTLNDKDFHIQSKANNCEIYIEENTNKNFRIDSIVLEGLFTPTSKQLK